MSGLLGGNNQADKAEADQAKAAGGRKRGRSMLTFLGADGQATLG
jgi:hypothetical protein